MATERLKNITVSKEVWKRLKLIELEMGYTHTQAVEYLLERNRELEAHEEAQVEIVTT